MKDAGLKPDEARCGAPGPQGRTRHARCWLWRWFSTTSLVAASMTASSSWPRSLWNVWMQWCELQNTLRFSGLIQGDDRFPCEAFSGHLFHSHPSLCSMCLDFNGLYILQIGTLPSHEIEDVPGKMVLEKILCRWRQALGWRIRLAPPGADQIF